LGNGLKYGCMVARFAPVFNLMKEYQERRRIKKILHSRYAIAILAIICLFFVRAVWNIHTKYEKSRDIAERARTELATLEAREKALKDSIAALGTEEGKEREIRDRFGVVKEGERMIVLVDESGDVEAQSSGEESLWSRFWGMFGL
jgi:cell division protein FtsB